MSGLDDACPDGGEHRGEEASAERTRTRSSEGARDLPGYEILRRLGEGAMQRLLRLVLIFIAVSPPIALATEPPRPLAVYVAAFGGDFALDPSVNSIQRALVDPWHQRWFALERDREKADLFLRVILQESAPVALTEKFTVNLSTVRARIVSGLPERERVLEGRSSGKRAGLWSEAGANLVDELRRIYERQEAEVATPKPSGGATVRTVEPSAAPLTGKTLKKIENSVKRLFDNKPAKRLEALTELEKLGPATEAALPALVLVLDDREEKVRAKAAAHIERLGPAALARQTRQASAPRLRRLMTASIQDPSVLAELARTGPNDIRLLAVERIVSETVLVALARTGPDGIRLPALEKITEAVLLAELARSGPPEIRARAVGKLDAPALLAELARTGPDDVRLPALEAIEDPALMGQLSLDGPEEVRSVALKWLVSRVLEGDSFETKFVALREIRDPATIEMLAEAATPDLRVSIFARITDPSVLARFARNPNPQIAKVALDRVTDAEVRAKAAAHPSWEVRLHALRWLEGDRLLGPIALNDPSAAVRIAALARLRGQQLLIQAAAKDPEPSIAGLAKELALTSDRGRLPLMTFVGVSGSPYVEGLQEKLATLFEQKALTHVCPGGDCSIFPNRVVVKVSTSDSDQCFQKFYVGGTCTMPGQDVRLTLGLYKGPVRLGETTLEARTPETVQYRTREIVDRGPAAEDIVRATASALAEKIKELEIDLDRPELAPLFEP